MKIWIAFVIALLTLTPVMAEEIPTLQASVSYTETTAREAAFVNLPRHFSMSALNFPGVLGGDNAWTHYAFGYVVQPKKDRFAYIVTGKKLSGVQVFEYPYLEKRYPQRAAIYRYPSGKLHSVQFYPTEKEYFSYTPGGRLTEHWQGEHAIKTSFRTRLLKSLFGESVNRRTFID
jgi:hypothetical protein